MNRVLVFIIFLAAFTAAFQAGSMYEHTEEDAKELTEQFMQEVQGIDDIGIFLHNTALALPMFIPGFGAAWCLFASASTGSILSAIISTYPDLNSIQPIQLLYLTPVGLLELTAYSLAGSRSIILFQRIWKRQNLRRVLPMTLIEICIVVVLLLIGAIVEYQMLQMVEDMNIPI